MRVKSSSGKSRYRWAYQKSYAYQVNRKGFLLSHLNEYAFMELFNIEDKKPIVMYFEENGEIKDEWTIAISEILFNRLFVYGDGFKNENNRDLIVLKGLADGKFYKAIAEELEIPEGTIKTLNRSGRMSQVIKEILGKDFSSMKEIADFLRSLGVI